MYFGLGNVVLVLVLAAMVGGAVLAGLAVGRALGRRAETSHEPLGVVQGTLLGLVGLLLAFGLSMAVSRYETRRSAVVAEANAIGTTHLRAQLLAEPERTASLDLLVRYADAAVAMAGEVPDSDAFDDATARVEALQRDLWAAAGRAVRTDPTGTAPRLYVETLNDMIDRHTDRVASLRNRVPTSVMVLMVAGSAVALGVLSLYLALLGRGVVTSLLAAAVVVLILFVSFDLDRPQRGFITVPSAPLVDARAAMDAPPATGP